MEITASTSHIIERILDWLDGILNLSLIQFCCNQVVWLMDSWCDVETVPATFGQNPSYCPYDRQTDGHPSSMIANTHTTNTPRTMSTSVKDPNIN